MINGQAAQKVLIIGGGFAGIETARLLAKKGLPIDITLVSNSATFQYYPNLYRLVVGATVNQVSAPLQDILPKNVTLIIDTYTSIDPVRQCVSTKKSGEISYDYVVMALGSEPNYFGIVGLAENSKSFLSIDKALALKKYYNDLVIECKTLSEQEARQRLHTVIVGAGPSGVELAGVLGSYLKRIAQKQKITSAFITVDLLDSSPRVLPAIPAIASAMVQKQLQKKGVTFLANHGVNSCDSNGVSVTDKSSGTEIKKDIAAGTVIWTAGTKINSLFSEIPQVVLTDRKRVQVSDSLTLPSNDKVYVIGDGSGTPYSGLAQTAIDQGQYVAEAITNRIRNNAVTSYIPKPGVFVIPVGKYWAILNFKDFVVSGFSAYIIRIIVDIRYFLTITFIGHVISMIKKEK